MNLFRPSGGQNQKTRELQPDPQEEFRLNALEFSDETKRHNQFIIRQKLPAVQSELCIRFNAASSLRSKTVGIYSAEHHIDWSHCEAGQMHVRDLSIEPGPKIGNFIGYTLIQFANRPTDRWELGSILDTAVWEPELSSWIKTLAFTPVDGAEIVMIDGLAEYQ